MEYQQGLAIKCCALLLASLAIAAVPASALDGPFLVKDIKPGTDGSYPRLFVPFGNQLFFGSNDGVTGSEPWISDATTGGTIQLANVDGGPGSSLSGCPLCKAVTIGPFLYFSTYNAQLWRTDGTPAGTINYYPTGLADDLENVGGTLFFSGTPPGYFLRYLCKIDGSGAIVQVSDVPISGNDLTGVNGTVFFTGGRGQGTELWKSDGTAVGTTMVKDIAPGGSSSYATLLTDVNGTLFFVATDDVNYGLFKSDGSAAGTIFLKSLTVMQVVNANGTAFLIASDGVSGVELWKSDGTIGGTVLVKDILPGTGDALSGSSLVAIGSSVYFAAIDGSFGRELWKSDGTTAGTVMVKDINPGSGNFSSSSPAGLANVNGTLFFRADAGFPNGTQIWTSDGTQAGTVQVAVLNPNPSGNSQAEFFTKIGSNIFFAGTDGSSGVELWKMSGAPLATVGPDGGQVAGGVSLAQNWPNPVTRAATQVSYSIPSSQHVVLRLYDLSGREVQTLVDAQKPAGSHTVDVRAGQSPSGMYFYRLETKSGIQQRKLLLIR